MVVDPLSHNLPSSLKQDDDDHKMTKRRYHYILPPPVQFGDHLLNYLTLGIKLG